MNLSNSNITINIIGLTAIGLLVLFSACYNSVDYNSNWIRVNRKTKSHFNNFLRHQHLVRKEFDHFLSHSDKEIVDSLRHTFYSILERDKIRHDSTKVYNEVDNYNALYKISYKRFRNQIQVQTDILFPWLTNDSNAFNKADYLCNKYQSELLAAQKKIYPEYYKLRKIESLHMNAYQNGKRPIINIKEIEASIPQIKADQIDVYTSLQFILVYIE